MQLASPKSEVGPIWYLHESLGSRWNPNLLQVLKVTAGMPQLITQSYIGWLTEATVTHLEFSEVLICSEHRADITPTEDIVTWSVRRKEMFSRILSTQVIHNIRRIYLLGHENSDLAQPLTRENNIHQGSLIFIILNQGQWSPLCPGDIRQCPETFLVATAYGRGTSAI